jgi:hypothetical protein
MMTGLDRIDDAMDGAGGKAGLGPKRYSDFFSTERRLGFREGTAGAEG